MVKRISGGIYELEENCESVFKHDAGIQYDDV